MNKLFVTVFIITSFISFGSCVDIKIDLSAFDPQDNEYSVFKKYYNLTDRFTKINITNIRDDVGFFIIQVHTYVENVTLSSTTKLNLGSYVIGTNIGLVWDSDNNTALFYLSRNIKVEQSLQILLVISLYDEDDPVPGGCNLSFETDVAPYQLTEYNDDVIIVKSQPPSIQGAPNCDDKKVQVDMYHLYLYEYDNTVETYFKNLEKMLTVKDILKNGRQVPDIGINKKYNRMYSSYRGTGEVFAVVSKYKNSTSAYVPTVSYGCDLLKWQESCLAPG
ncbi:unnamed protein product [Psylliodes chrysocephalus]|uniref:Uncharacterized protein n=1 Tax=Psylliodes chrysocephalus TaxID=3402493 RepID=A0A9P0GCY3_9CUCU|nr:unnamed protein product [Psylliodes chrysocephala]